MTSLEAELYALAEVLAETELVPGMLLPRPSFEPTWRDARALVAPCFSPPETFWRFVEEVGAIEAIDIAGGVGFFTPKQACEHVGQDYGPRLREIEGRPCFPFGVNGGGETLLLAEDDSAVWLFDVHMSPFAQPKRIASGWRDFLARLVEDWRAIVDGRGGPYLTS